MPETPRRRPRAARHRAGEVVNTALDMQRDAGERGARTTDEECVIDDVQRSGDILYRQREHVKREASAIDIETEADVI